MLGRFGSARLSSRRGGVLRTSGPPITSIMPSVRAVGFPGCRTLGFCRKPRLLVRSREILWARGSPTCAVARTVKSSRHPKCSRLGSCCAGFHRSLDPAVSTRLFDGTCHKVSTFAMLAERTLSLATTMWRRTSRLNSWGDRTSSEDGGTSTMSPTTRIGGESGLALLPLLLLQCAAGRGLEGGGSVGVGRRLFIAS